jgi:hypothetical protein
VSDEVLTCWPKGFLTKEEASAFLQCLEEMDTGEDGLTTEEEMGRDKLIAAIKATPDD